MLEDITRKEVAGFLRTFQDLYEQEKITKTQLIQLSRAVAGPYLLQEFEKLINKSLGNLK